MLSAQDIPPTAIDRSILALKTLQSLCTTVEEKRNERSCSISLTLFYDHFYSFSDLDSSKLPNTIAFLRTDVDSNEFKIVASTKPIFQNLPHPGNFPVHGMTLNDLKQSSKLFSPFKLFYITFNLQNPQVFLVLVMPVVSPTLTSLKIPAILRRAI